MPVVTDHALSAATEISLPYELRKNLHSAKPKRQEAAKRLIAAALVVVEARDRNRQVPVTALKQSRFGNDAPKRLGAVGAAKTVSGVLVGSGLVEAISHPVAGVPGVLAGVVTFAIAAKRQYEIKQQIIELAALYPEVEEALTAFDDKLKRWGSQTRMKETVKEETVEKLFAIVDLPGNREVMHEIANMAHIEMRGGFER